MVAGSFSFEDRDVWGCLGDVGKRKKGENQVESASLHNLFEISEVAFVVYLPA